MYPISERNYIQQVSIDCVIFGYQKKQLKVLIPKLAFTGDFCALPSGFIYQDEDTDEAARRILQERTGLEEAHLEPFQVAGKANRNSRAFIDRLIELNPDNLTGKEYHRREYEWFTKRFISIGYIALVDIDKAIPQTNAIYESFEWYAVNALPQMIMDHSEIVANAFNILKANLDLKLDVCKLLPETFTMMEVQELYETILAKSFARNNFPKKILDMNILERLEKKFTGAANKAPYLYRFPKQTIPQSEEVGEQEYRY